MAIDLSIFRNGWARRGAGLLAAFLDFGVARLAHSELPKGHIKPTGVRALSDGSILVFTTFRPCGKGADEDVGRILESRDRGKSWNVVVTDNNGELYRFSYEFPRGVIWVAGVVYREGPTSSPFVLVRANSTEPWHRYRIYDGPAELEGIAMDATHRFHASVRHLSLGDNGWTGPVFVYEGDEMGRRWTVSKKPIPSTSTGFQRIELTDGDWRITDAESNNPTVEHKQSGASWQTASTLRSPCSD